jgi:hypothetical protein
VAVLGWPVARQQLEESLPCALRSSIAQPRQVVAVEVENVECEIR